MITPLTAQLKLRMHADKSYLSLNPYSLIMQLTFGWCDLYFEFAIGGGAFQFEFVLDFDIFAILHIR